MYFHSYRTSSFGTPSLSSRELPPVLLPLVVPFDPLLHRPPPPFFEGPRTSIRLFPLPREDTVSSPATPIFVGGRTLRVPTPDRRFPPHFPWFSFGLSTPYFLGLSGLYFPPSPPLSGLSRDTLPPRRLHWVHPLPPRPLPPTPPFVPSLRPLPPSPPSDPSLRPLPPTPSSPRATTHFVLLTSPFSLCPNLSGLQRCGWRPLTLIPVLS